MIVGIGAFATYSALTQPGASKPVTLQANAQGKLVPVDRPVVLKDAVPPLWKPEPSLLLSRDRELRLTAGQVAEIGKVSSEWDRSKAALESEIKKSTEQFSAGSRFSMASSQGELADYSELSREFDRRRQAAWSSALSVLDSEQRELVAQWQKPAQVTK